LRRSRNRSSACGSDAATTPTGTRSHGPESALRREFGSHIGTGLLVKNASVGVAFQHLSNAGIKQPNGGINFYLATVSLEL